MTVLEARKRPPEAEIEEQTSEDRESTKIDNEPTKTYEKQTSSSSSTSALRPMGTACEIWDADGGPLLFGRRRNGVRL